MRARTCRRSIADLRGRFFEHEIRLPRMPPRPDAALAEQIRARIADSRSSTLPALRKLRSALNRELREVAAKTLLACGVELAAEPRSCPRWFAFELLHHHKPALAALDARWLRRLGRDLAHWGEVDPFALYLLGPAWRESAVSDAELARWARDRAPLQRRAALVATVALNCKARGGSGDARRTLLICDLLRADRDDMVVKAMSWALRELAAREPQLVARYLDEYTHDLAARVKREVGKKLRTGLKNPTRTSAGGRGTARGGQGRQSRQ